MRSMMSRDRINRRRRSITRRRRKMRKRDRRQECTEGAGRGEGG